MVEEVKLGLQTLREALYVQQMVLDNLPPKTRYVCHASSLEDGQNVEHVPEASNLIIQHTAIWHRR